MVNFEQRIQTKTRIASNRACRMRPKAAPSQAIQLLLLLRLGARTGQRPRQRSADVVIEEIVQLRRLGFRFIALADDNFYPVTLTDLRLAEEQHNTERLNELKTIRAEPFSLMRRLAHLPSDTIFFTQITMEAAEDPEFLDAMHAALIKGDLVGVESVTGEGLKDVYKEFNCAGEDLINRLRTFRRHGVYVLGSFIFGLPSDRPETFDATAAAAVQAEIAFAQFVLLTPYPGTVDFNRWEKQMDGAPIQIGGVSITRRWLRKPSDRSSIGLIPPCRLRKFANAPNPSGKSSTV